MQNKQNNIKLRKKKQTQFCVFSFLYIRMSKNKRENLFFSHSDCTQEIPIQSSSFGRAKLYLPRVREKEMVFDTKQTFFEARSHARERFERAQCSEKRELKTRESAERERARDFCDDDEEKLRSSVACFDGVRVREELKLVTSRHIASHGWLANHLNALRFRC